MDLVVFAVFDVFGPSHATHAQIAPTGGPLISVVYALEWRSERGMVHKRVVDASSHLLAREFVAWWLHLTHFFSVGIHMGSGRGLAMNCCCLR